ncbi:MAG: hypothetical protein U9R79_15385 [Armatimonadota bacterium]|nr:hypothetical protein [Armatimonadota bacterium]
MVFTSCQGGDGIGPVPDGGEDLETTFDVTWDQSATVIDEDHLGLVKDVDPDNHRYTLDADGVQAAGLDISAGRVLVIHGIALRKITSVQQDGQNLVVDTEFAALPEAIEEGTIEWDYGVRFTEDTITAPSVAGQVMPRVPGTVEPQFKFTYGDYTYDIKITPQGDKVTFNFTLEKDLPGPAGAKLVAEGFVQRFRHRGRISITDNKVDEFVNRLDKMQGQATVKVIMAGSGRDVINYKPDFTLISLNFLVGPVPMKLGISAQFVINASVPVEGSANLRLTIDYDSDLGFRFSGGTPQVEGGVRSLDQGDKRTEVGAAAAIGANFGLGFPRVKLSICESLTGWIQPAYLLGGSFTFTPPCVEVKGRFIASAGADVSAKIFGADFKYDIWSKTLAEKEWVLFRSAECPDAAAVAAIGEPLDAAVAGR